jgi:hypothetical protein
VKPHRRKIYTAFLERGTAVHSIEIKHAPICCVVLAHTKQASASLTCNMCGSSSMPAAPHCTAPVDGNCCVLPVVCAVVAWPHELGDAEVLALDPEAVRGIHAVVHHAAAVSGVHGHSVIAAGPGSSGYSRQDM